MRWPRLGPLWAAVGVATLWIGAIVVLAWTTSNPVTLNVEQILDSDFIAVGQRVAGPALEIEPVPDRQWPFSDRKPVKVANLDETGARHGQIYLFPLTRLEDAPANDPFASFVTRSHLPNSAPLIYPATPEAMKQLETILSKHPAAAGAQPRPPAARD